MIYLAKSASWRKNKSSRLRSLIKEFLVIRIKTTYYDKNARNGNFNWHFFIKILIAIELNLATSRKNQFVRTRTY